jgi:ABC-type Fe3+/spermidine/putrescine transport system ATPase subunit
MGMVFQNYALFPHLTAFENIAFGLRSRKVPSGDIERRVKNALALTHLTSFERHYPRQLSGGQQQRVALARALVIEPTVLLLDEPFSNLDAKLRRQMRDEVRDIQRRVGITTVFVTHDQEEALAISDRIAVLRDGLIEDVGTPVDIYRRPSSDFVASFVGDVNVIGSFYLRPEALRLRPPSGRDGDALTGTVAGITFLGARRRYRIRTEHVDTELVAEVAETGAEQFRFGERVVVDWDPADATTLREG